jgi:hypothetical protein
VGEFWGLKAQESCAFPSDFGLRPALRFGIRDGWQDEQNKGGDSGMRIASLVFDRNQQYAAFSVIRKRGSLGSSGVQKNGLRLLRSSADGPVRSQGAPRARSVVRRRKIMRQLGAQLRAKRSSRSGKRHAGRADLAAPRKIRRHRAILPGKFACVLDSRGSWRCIPAVAERSHRLAGSLGACLRNMSEH